MRARRLAIVLAVSLLGAGLPSRGQAAEWRTSAGDSVAGFPNEVTIEGPPQAAGTLRVQRGAPRADLTHPFTLSATGGGSVKISGGNLTTARTYEVGIDGIPGGKSEFRVFAGAFDADKSDCETARAATTVDVGQTLTGRCTFTDRYANALTSRTAPMATSSNPSIATVTIDAGMTDDEGAVPFTITGVVSGMARVEFTDVLSGEEFAALEVKVGGSVALGEVGGLTLQGLGGDLGSLALVASLLNLVEDLKRQKEQEAESGAPYTSAASFTMEVPSVISSDSPTDFSVVARDADGDIARDFIGEVRFDATDQSARLPVRGIFQPSHRGRLSFSLGASFSSLGRQVITVSAVDDPDVRGQAEVLVVGREFTRPREEILILEPTPGQILPTTTVNVRGSAPTYVNLRLLLDGLPVGGVFSSDAEGKFETRVIFPSGVKNSEVVVEQLGGLSLVSQAVPIVLDTVGPAIADASLLPTTVKAKDRVTFRVLTGPGLSVQVDIGGGSLPLSPQSIEEGRQWYEGTAEAPVEVGEVTVTFIVMDEIGHRTEAMQTLTIVARGLPVVENVRAVLEGEDTILSWLPVEGAQRYRIYLGATAESLDRTLEVPAGFTQARITKLVPGEEVALAVTAIGEGDEESVARSAVVTVVVPLQEMPVSARSRISGAELSWFPVFAGSAETVRLEYGVEPGVYTEVRSVAAPPGTAILGDLIDGVRYYGAATPLDAAGQPVGAVQTFSVVPGVSGDRTFHPVTADPVPASFLSSLTSILTTATPPTVHAVAPPRPLEIPRSGSLGVATVGILLVGLVAVIVAVRFSWQRSRERSLLLAIQRRYVLVHV